MIECKDGKHVAVVEAWDVSGSEAFIEAPVAIMCECVRESLRDIRGMAFEAFKDAADAKVPLPPEPVSPAKEFETALRSALSRLSSSAYELHGFSASIAKPGFFMIDIMIVSYMPYEIFNPLGAPDLARSLQEAGFIISGHGKLIPYGEGAKTMIHDVEIMFVKPNYERWLARQAELPIVRKGSLWPSSSYPDSIETDLFAGKKGESHD